jgi:hypothetical protein
MSRQIDFSKPLSEEDKQYALDRNMAIDVEENEKKFSEIQETGEKVDIVSSGLNGNEPSRFADKSEVSGLGLAQVNAGPTTEEVVVKEEVIEETVEVSEGEEIDDDDYNTWSLDDLKIELGERQLSKSGNKAELVARLTADDQNSE